MSLTSFLPILSTSSNRRGKISPKKKDVIAWMVVIKYLKSSGDDLWLLTSFSDHGDIIFWKEKRQERCHLGLTKTAGIHKMFDYIPNRIESAKNLNTGTKIRDRWSRTGKQSRFFIFWEKMVGSGPVGRQTVNTPIFLPNIPKSQWPTPGAWPQQQNANSVQWVLYLLFVKTQEDLSLYNWKIVDWT